MESINISFSANKQMLTGGGLYCASNTVHYIIADFELGDGWDGFDSVRAVWSNDFKCISTVLDPNGSCTVPHEVLERRGKVTVNLVGSILEDDELTDRLTTYPVLAITVDANAKICGTETAEVTPSQFEQYVAIVIAEVEKVTGMTAVAYALPEGSAPTANYSDGVLTLGIPKGDTGATGNGISSVEFNEDYSLTFYFTDSEPFTTPSIRGAQGARGYGIASVEKIDTTGLVDTYRINFEDPSLQPTTFIVTNGEEGQQGPRGYTGETGNGIDRIELTDTTGAVKTYTIYFTDGSTYDFEVTDGEVTLAELASVLPTDTASGAIASFEDGSDLFDYLSCVVEINPVQAGSGTPSPDNVRPITGWTGCEVDVVGFNQWDEEWEVGGYASASGNPWATNDRIRSKTTNYIPILPNTTYYVKTRTSTYLDICFYDADKGFISRSLVDNAYTFVTPSSARYMRFATSASYGTTYNHDICINLSDASLNGTYQPYNPNSAVYPVSWQTEAGTVYGGKLHIAIVNGEPKTWIVVTHIYKALNGTETYTTTTTGLFRLAPSPNMASGRFYSDPKAECDSYRKVEMTADMVDGDVVFGSGNGHIYFSDSRASTVAEFKALLATQNVGITYPLLTQQTYQLTPVQVACLLGQNNVWADCGDVDEVQYKADVQKWVEKQLREINTAILALS